MEQNKDQTNKSVNDRVLLQNLNSTLQYFDFEDMSNQQIVDKYEETLWHREQQIKQLSNAIGILNEKIVHAADVNKRLFEEIDKLKADNEMKDIVLTKELRNKELMFEQINTIVAENNRINKTMKTYEQVIQVQNDQKEKDKESIKEKDKMLQAMIVEDNCQKKESEKKEEIIQEVKVEVLTVEDEEMKEEMNVKEDAPESMEINDYSDKNDNDIEEHNMKEENIEVIQKEQEVFEEDCICIQIKPQLQPLIDKNESLIETIVIEEAVADMKFEEPIINDKILLMENKSDNICDDEPLINNDIPQYSCEQNIEEIEPIIENCMPKSYINTLVINEIEPIIESNKQQETLQDNNYKEIQPQLENYLLKKIPYNDNNNQEPKTEELTIVKEAPIEETKVEKTIIEETKVEETKFETKDFNNEKFEEINQVPNEEISIITSTNQLFSLKSSDNNKKSELFKEEPKEEEIDIITSTNQLFSLKSPDKINKSEPVKEEPKEEDIDIVASTNQLFAPKLLQPSIIQSINEDTEPLKDQPSQSESSQVNQLDDAKAKKKKRKPKPKPVTIQPLGSDSITYEPFFK